MVDQINTRRLCLKLVASEDSSFIYKLVNSQGWITFIGDRNIDSAEAAIRFIEKITATPDFYYWVIRERDSNLAVGIVSFLKRDYLPHFDVGFAVLPEYQRKGYAFEATSQIITEYKQLGHTNILAIVLPLNTNSIGLLQKLGFIHLQDMVVNQESMHVFSNQVPVITN